MNDTITLFAELFVFRNKSTPVINPRQPSFDILNLSTALYLPSHSLAFASALSSIRRTNLIHEFIFSRAIQKE